MTIYVNNDVIAKEDDYADFLVKECGYSLNEANTRIWEIEYQISRRCHPMLMKPNTKGTIKFKNVLKRQEIQRLVGNATKLSQLVNRRRGNNRNTQWIADYYVTINGDVFIWKLQCYSMLPEGINKELNNATNKIRNMNNKKVVRLTESQLHNIIAESVSQLLMELDPRTYASYADKRRQQAQQSTDYGDISKFADKAEKGEQAARNAWNKKYAYDYTQRNGLNYQYGRREMIKTNDSPYTTHMQSFTNGVYGDEPKQSVSINRNGTEDADRIARQMRDGTGNFIKGKGWQ